ncbi:hypothetical protein FALBO_12978 [Fusarium albosuccineum]|uniref:Uncharacterized protein n=1 Tax=Fusarium albosuccineum TaxID=1237068 RepID=A0A8H4P7H9_9HYPO|nr:hypothetical protein FALBO_12978 [Fusarium albosuccineum]
MCRIFHVGGSKKKLLAMDSQMDLMLGSRAEGEGSQFPGVRTNTDDPSVHQISDEPGTVQDSFWNNLYVSSLTVAPAEQAPMLSQPWLVSGCVLGIGGFDQTP